MCALVAGVHCVLMADNELILDPNQLDFEQAVASLTFVFESIHLNMVASHTSGRFTIEQYHRAVMRCKHASKSIFNFYRTAMENYTTDTVGTEDKNKIQS